jgi:hypothetical protein
MGSENRFDERSNCNIAGEVNRDVGMSPASRVKTFCVKIVEDNKCIFYGRKM